MIIKMMTENIQSNKEINKIGYSQDKPKQPPPLQEMMIIPSDINRNQPRSTQVCN